MFTQIVDLLVRKRKDRTRILLLSLRLLFSVVLTAMLAAGLGFEYKSLLKADLNVLLEKCLDGTLVLAFALLFLVWKWSYGLIDFILTGVALFSAERLYRFLAKAIGGSPGLNSKPLYVIVRDIFLWFFNMVDIVRVEHGSVRPGTQFYKFYDYLRAVDKGKQRTDVQQFMLSIALGLQFMIIWANLEVAPQLPWYVTAAGVIVLLNLFVSGLVGLILDTLIAIKHGLLLDLLTPLDPEYAQRKNKRSFAPRFTPAVSMQ